MRAGLIFSLLCAAQAAEFDIVITSFPPAGAITPISGKVVNLALPATYNVFCFSQDVRGGLGHWWSKPVAPIAADGSFSCVWGNNAVTSPTDINFAIYVVPLATPFIAVADGLPPGSVILASVASAQYPRGYIVPVVGTPKIVITVFPPAGAITPISGVVTDLVLPATYTVFCYSQSSLGAANDWWSKPVAPIAADGSFSCVWGDNPITSPNDISFQLYVVPIATPLVTVANGFLPASVAAAAVTGIQLPRGYIAPVIPPVGTPKIVITAFPPAGAITPISGRVTNLTSPATYKMFCYSLDSRGGDTHWWSKKWGSSAIDGSGAFTCIWGDNAVTSPNDVSFAMYIVPLATPFVTVSDGPLPPSVISASVAGVQLPRGWIIAATSFALGGSVSSGGSSSGNSNGSGMSSGLVGGLAGIGGFVGALALVAIVHLVRRTSRNNGGAT